MEDHLGRTQESGANRVLTLGKAVDFARGGTCRDERIESRLGVPGRTESASRRGYGDLSLFARTANATKTRAAKTGTASPNSGTEWMAEVVLLIVVVIVLETV